MTEKKAQAKKKTTAKKSASSKTAAKKKSPAKKATAKKVPAKKKPGRPAKVKVENNVIKIDDIAEITVDQAVVNEVTEVIVATVAKQPLLKRFFSFLKK